MGIKWKPVDWNPKSSTYLQELPERETEIDSTPTFLKVDPSEVKPDPIPPAPISATNVMELAEDPEIKEALNRFESNEDRVNFMVEVMKNRDNPEMTLDDISRTVFDAKRNMMNQQPDIEPEPINIFSQE